MFDVVLNPNSPWTRCNKFPDLQPDFGGEEREQGEGGGTHGGWGRVNVSYFLNQAVLNSVEFEALFVTEIHRSLIGGRESTG